MEHLRWHHHPRLRRPIMVAAFEGWNYASDASSSASRYLRDVWRGRPFGTMDHEGCFNAGIPSASLWAAVPHYVGGTPSPKAALALVRRAASLLATPLMTTDLEIASAAYESQVSEVVDEDEDVAGYVRRLELVGDDDDDDDDDGHAPEGSTGEVDGEQLGADLERFLREQG